MISSTFKPNHILLMEIVRLALALNWVTGREITSADFEPYIILWDTVFDPTAMEDLSEEPAHLKLKTSEEEEDHVLCTTDLGLRRIEKLPKAKGGTGGDIQTTVLLKPKVALHSVIQSLEGVKRLMDSPMSMSTRELLPFA